MNTMHALPMCSLNKQRGLSIGGFLGIAIVVVFLVLMGFKLVPSYLEYKAISKALHEIAQKPEVVSAGSTAAQNKAIADAFDKYQMIDISIRNISSDDLNIDSDTGEISADYSVKVPVAGNVSLLIEFHPSSAH